MGTKEIITIVLLCINLATIVSGLCTFLCVKASRSSYHVIRVHRYVLIVGVIICIFLSALLLLGINGKNDESKFAFLTVLAIPLCMLGAAPVLLYSNYKIQYYDNSFAYRNIFRIRRQYGYCDISGIIEDRLYSKLVINSKKMLRIHTFSVGRNEFMKTIEQWRCNNGSPSKKLPKLDEKLLNNNVEDAEGFVALWIISILFSGTLFFGCLIMSFQYKNYNGAIFTGVFLLLFIVFGLFFRYFVRNAEKYPRVIRCLVNPRYIKNPLVRAKLGLRSLNVNGKKK